MLETLFGGATAEKVLLYLASYGEGYAKEIADRFSIPFSMVQKQLMKFEAAGLLASQLKGRTRVYVWSPRFPLKDETLALLQRALEFLPSGERQRYFQAGRRRPRRPGKP
jgi:DNA-binding IclR family transcriptional regulator